ncbi:MAG: hypothetical protein WED33_10880 [Bacteroidia bacterium]
MKLFRYLSALILFVSISGVGFAQVKLSKTEPASSLCTDYHKKACKFEKQDILFKYNSQSRDALFRPGQTSKLTFTATKGYDYRLTFAAEDKILQGGNISFKIYDARTKQPLFDSEEEGQAEFEFICDSSINLTIEISLSEASAEAKSKVLYGCVGFLLESRKTLDTGF